MSQEEKEISPITMSELMSKEFAPIEWLVEGLIPIGGITAFSGCPGSYKTWLMLALSVSVAQGEDFLERFKTKKQKVLIIDEESCERNLKERLSRLTGEIELGIEFLSYSDFTLKKTDWMVGYCLENNIGVVMIDSLIRVSQLKDENSSADTAKIFSEFKKFKKNDITLILLHHNRKSGQRNDSGESGEEMRGSSELLAFLDSALSFKKRKNDEIKITQTKSRMDEELAPFIIKVIKGEGSTSFEFLGHIEDQKNQDKSEMAEEKIIELLKANNDGLFRQDIFIALDANCRPHSIKKALVYLVSSGKIIQTRGKGNSHFYSIKS